MAGDTVLGTAELGGNGENAVASLSIDLAQVDAGSVITARYEGNESYEGASAARALGE